MPRMHAISLLSSGALIGTIVGYAIARYGPQMSPVSNGQGGPTGTSSSTPEERPGLIDRIRSVFKRPVTAGTSSVNATGNQAFDAYREVTLRQLQDEQQAFEAYLEQLRRAKDKETFDAYLANGSPKHQDPDEAQRD